MTDAERALRVCIHCSKHKCDCRFKAPNKYAYKIEISNQSTGVTVGEMVQAIQSAFVGDGRPVAFKITAYIGEEL